MSHEPFTLSDNEGPVIDPSMFSFTDDEQNLSTYSIPSISEPAIIGNVSLSVPLALYQLPSLSSVLWPAFQALPDSDKQSLLALLPQTAEDQESPLKSAELLLTESLDYFGASPLSLFFSKLRAAYYHPRLVKSRSRLFQIHEQIYRQRCRNHHLNQIISVVDTKHRLLVPQVIRPISSSQPSPPLTAPVSKVSLLDQYKSRMTRSFEPLQSTYPASFIVAIRDTLLSFESLSCPLQPLLSIVSQKPEIQANLSNERTRPTHYSPEEITRLALFYLASPPTTVMYVRWVERTLEGEWRWIGPLEPPSQQFMAKLHVDFLARCCSSPKDAAPPVSSSFNRLPFDSLKVRAPKTIPFYDPEMIREYQWQESERYQTPNKSFSFVIRGDRFPVAPAVRSGTRGRGGPRSKEHSVLSSDRPSSVTVVSIVRDAACRVPDGVGTRSDIVLLAMTSQYVKADEETAKNAVSGALDRLQGENDPCVKYDASNHLWLYLHYHRTEEMMSTPSTTRRKKSSSGPKKKKKVVYEPDSEED
ncbi:hypothetical protein GEMRC1_013772 [Eukaryota sp. GEM-RC1]